MEQQLRSEDIHVPQFDSYPLHKCIFPYPRALPTNLEELKALIIARQHETKGEDEEALDLNANLPNLTTAIGTFEPPEGTFPLFPTSSSSQSLMHIILESAQRIQELFPAMEIPTLPQGSKGSVELTYEQVH